MQRSALSVLILSVFLFSLVTIDFFKLQNISGEPQTLGEKTNLVDKANEIGRVLGDVLPGSTGSTYYYKFYLKDQTGTAITSQENSDKALIKGATVSVTNKSSFTCGDGGTNYSFAEYDGLYKILCNESATMQIRISKSGYSTKNTSLSVYNGEIPTIYLSRYVAPPPPPPPETIKDVKLPGEFSETGGSTNLAAISDPTNVTDLTLDTNSSTIKFKEAVNLADSTVKDKFKELNKYVKADQKGVVGVDSVNLPVLNKKATITMKSLAFVKQPKVLVDGKEDKSVVSNIVYKDGTLTFDVTHFSTFTAVPTIEIKEPVNNFETKTKKLTLRGSVSDPTASVSAKLNNQDLGKLEVATQSGEFKKEIELSVGKNNIVVSALTSNLATVSASVSATLIKSTNLAFMYLLLLILLAFSAYGIFAGLKKLWVKTPGKKIDDSMSKEAENNPKSQI